MGSHKCCPLPQQPHKQGGPQRRGTLDLLVRQIVQRLQDQHPEQDERVDRLAAPLLFQARRPSAPQPHCRRGTSPTSPAQKFRQRVALRRQSRKTLVRIEEAELRYHRLPAKASRHRRDSHMSAHDAAIRSALYSEPECWNHLKEAGHVCDKPLRPPINVKGTSNNGVESRPVRISSLPR